MMSLRAVDRSLLFGVYHKFFRYNSIAFQPKRFGQSVVNRLNVKFIWTSIPKRCLSAQEAISESRPLTTRLDFSPDSYVKKKIFFNDTENQFAFGIIESVLNREKFDLSEEQLEDNEKYNRFVEEFLKIDPQNFRNYPFVISDLVKCIKFLSIKQLSLVLQSMTEWPVYNNTFDPLFFKTWSNIDHEMDARLRKVNFGDNKQVLEYLVIGNLFYRLRIANISRFNETLAEKLISPDFELNKVSLLHLMFYVNLHRKLDPRAVTSLMKILMKAMNDLSLEEVAVIAMSLFKTRTKISQDLVKELISKACKDMSDETPSMIRTAITKCIRKSVPEFHHKIKPELREYLDKMKSLTNNSEITLAHILNLMASAYTHDPELIAHAIDRVEANPTAFRIKDIERIFLSLSYFESDVDIKKLESICEKLNSRSEELNVFQYPLCLLNILHYLCIVKCYPKPLIQNCFDPPFLVKIQKYGKLDFQRHLLLTNTALSVEKYEEFKDVLLPPEKVYRYHRWILSEEKNHNHITKKHSTLNSIYLGLQPNLKRRVQLCHVLPFKSYPFVVIFDDPKRTFSLTPTTQLRPNLFDNCIVIFILEISDYAVMDTMLKGSVRLEIRLLEALGFKVVVIPWHKIMCYSTSRARNNLIREEILNIDPEFKFDRKL